MKSELATLIAAIERGGRVPPSELLDALEPELPLIRQMAETPQDPQWHAEGNVRIHTEQVIDEVYGVADSERVSPEDRLALVLAAALHDVGKALTTREREIDGKVRIVSPRHAMRGRSYAAPRLRVRDALWERVLGCVGYHHHPRQLVADERGAPAYLRLARRADLRLLYLLEIADIRGRDCGDDSEQLEILEFFRMSAEEFGLWEDAEPYADWRNTIAGALEGEDESTIGYVVANAIRDFEAGLIFTPEEAVARTHEHRQDFCEVVVTCGLSGAGKTTWVAENLPGYRVVSLDAIREELTGKASDQSMNGQVLQEAKERLRACLRKRQDVVWDSTALRRDGRAAVVDLAHDYHATTRIVAFAASPLCVSQQNRGRTAAVPQRVLERQMERLEWPEVTEADRLEVVRSEI